MLHFTHSGNSLRECPRSWMRLTLSVTMSIGSRYWASEELAWCDNEAHVRPHGGYLLVNLSSPLAGLLTANPGLDDGSYISIFLREAPEGIDSVQGQDIPIKMEIPNTDISNYLREITK